MPPFAWRVLRSITLANLHRITEAVEQGENYEDVDEAHKDAQAAYIRIHNQEPDIGDTFTTFILYELRNGFWDEL